MRNLVAYYSRTGNTRKVAQNIAGMLGANIDEIIDLKDRSGIKGWILGGRDAMANKPTEIRNSRDASIYDLVIIGTPIWVGTAAPAVKAYLLKYKFKNVAFFCTAGNKQTRAFKDMEKLSSKPLATMDLKEKKLDDPSTNDKIRGFCNKLR